MTSSLRVIAVASAVVASQWIGPEPARAQSVVFQGFKHTPVGAATLRVDTSRNVLDVSGLGAAGEDGVAVKTAAATSWTARFGVNAVSGVPLRLSWNAIADGRRIGSAILRQSGTQFAITPVFTGATANPTFSAQVYNAGRLVGAVGNQPQSSGIPTLADICRTTPEFCEFTGEFHTLPSGACVVSVLLGAVTSFRLPNGAVFTGDELRLVEEVRPGSHYPYLGFDTMTMLSNARSFEIRSETLR